MASRRGSCKEDNLFVNEARRRGFAVVLALVLMSFVLVLLLSLTTLVRVESSGAAAKLDRLTAQQNALLGLKVGLGRLQSSMGPDTRVSARADRFNRRGEAPDIPIAGERWVGVWDASILAAEAGETIVDVLDRQRAYDALPELDKRSSTLSWLVSQADPTNPVGPEAIDGLGPTEAPVLARLPGVDGLQAEALQAPRRSIRGPNSGEMGGYAFWVDDEGMKARLNLTESRPLGGGGNALRTQFAVAARTAPEILFPDFPLVSTERARLGGVGDLVHFGADAATVAALGEGLTGRSQSLMVDTIGGGLRRDLSLALGHTDDPGDMPGDLVADNFRTDRGAYLFTLDAFPGDSGALTAPGAPWTVVRDYLNAAERRPDWPDRDGTLRAPLRLKEGGDILLPESRDHPVSPTMGYVGSFGNDPNPMNYFETWATNGNTKPSIDFAPIGAGGMSPVITEFRLYFSVAERVIDGAPRLVVQVRPFLEMTNPYNRPIHIGNMRFQVAFPSPSIDIEVVADPGTPEQETKVWSVDGASDLAAQGAIEPRLILNILTANQRLDVPDEETFGAIQNRFETTLGFFLQNAITDGTLAPGETKSFVLGEDYWDEFDITRWNVPHFDLQEGSRWDEHSIEAQIRRYSFATDSLGQETIRYSGHWPATPGGLGDFDNLVTRLEFSPLYPTDGDSVVRSMEMRLTQGSALTAVDYQSGELLPPVIEELTEFSPGNRSGGAYVREVATAIGSLNVSSLLVLQAERVSADGFAGEAHSEALPDGGFLAHTNPRSYLLHDATGFDGSAGLDNAAWRWRAFDSSGHSSLQDAAVWGRSNNDPTEVDDVYFHDPRPGEEIASIGALRHLNVSFDTSDPAYLIGNGLRNASALGRTETHRFASLDAEPWSVNTPLGLAGGSFNESLTHTRRDYLVDSGFFYNRALWDDWFFSSVPETGDSGDPREWRNPRFRILPEAAFTGQVPSDWDGASALDDDRRIAARLTLEGGFNINSTSERAWAAVLAGLAGIDYPGGDNGDGAFAVDADEVAFPRTPYQPGGRGEAWSGVPVLDFDALFRAEQAADDNIETLSRHIVDVIKERGPFLSIAHFVNRLLADDVRGDRGALAEAIQRSGINAGLTPDAPGSLAQHDLLEPLGPFLNARSDTFRIVVRGDSVDPVSGQVATAWCEALVQRRPYYVDPVDPPEAESSGLSSVNTRFGRRFEIVEFRWLDPEATNFAL